MRPFLAPERRRNRSEHAQAGSVLLEVVLALALFVGAATIISGGLNASIRSVDRVRLQNHALNLAISVVSEMQMHARPVAAMGPEPFAPPFQDWTFKIEINADSGSAESIDSSRPVEVIVRNSEENVTFRLTQLFSGVDVASAEAAGKPEDGGNLTP